MITRAIAILAAAFLFTGCGKKAEAPSPAPQPTVQPMPAETTPAETTPAETASTEPSQSTTNATPTGAIGGVPKAEPIIPIAVSPSNANTPPDIGALNRQVRQWMARHQAVPKDFEEFAATSGLQIPPPPPGKKYALDNKLHVILVSK